MYGHLNEIIRVYIIERHGEEAWNNVVKQSKCSSTFNTSAVYDDAITQKILDAASKCLGLKREPLLELIGEYYFEHLQKSGYEEFLRNLGDNILDFIQNLDSLHSTMTTHYPEMNAPSFRCDSDSSKDRLVLHYYSFRKGYAHLTCVILQSLIKHEYLSRHPGDNILDFIQNLDSLHSTMTTHYPEMNAPSFRCDSDSSKDRLVLHYYSFRKGYAHLTCDIVDFIQNLDSLHSVTMTAHYPEMNAPSFRCDSDSSKDRLVLHYYSFRKGYAHLTIVQVRIVICGSRLDLDSLHSTMTAHYSFRKGYAHLTCGILRGAAKTYFRMELTITVLSITNEKLSTKHGPREHVTYNILASAMAGGDTDGPPTLIAQTKKHGEKQILKADVESVKRRLSEIRRNQGEDALPVQLHRSKIAKAKWKAVAKLSILRRGFVINYPETLGVNPRRFCEIFPYHLVFTTSLQVHQSGEMLQRMMPNIRTATAELPTFFTLVNPHSMDFTYENIQKFINAPFVLKMKKESLSKDWANSEEMVVLKGQMLPLPAENMMLYLGSPFVRSFRHLEERKIYYSNIAGHDVTRDLLFMEMMFRNQVSDENRKSVGKQKQKYGNRGNRGAVVIAGDDGYHDNDDLSDELERTRRLLEEEREKNAALVYHFLPSPLADRVRNGERIDTAGEYRAVSVLFCDIVNFLQYPTECKVSSVVSLLNQLHEKFDRVTKVHDTFRVETIGDAYLVISGIPDKLSTHVERVANTALGMMVVCEEVKSPISWSHNVQIRMGIHTGPLKCGVIGEVIPRLIIMGETATIASRMESHGESGRVHVTPTVYNALHNKGYSLKERGEINLRGLGDITTYFLISNDNASHAELVGQRSKDNQISFINEGNEEKVLFNGNKGYSRSNKVKPAQGTPSSGVGSSSRPDTGEEDFVAYQYSDNRQGKNKLRK